MTADRTIDTGGARRAYLWVAATSIALTLAVVVASAYLRHLQAGLSCEPWPACYARIDAAATFDSTASVRIARTIHRFSATAVAAALVALVLIAWTQRPLWLREALVGTTALAVAAALAVLGIVAAGSKVPAVVLGNLIGGHVLLSLVAAASSFAVESSAVSGRVRALAATALIVTLAANVLGGSIGAHFASGACPQLVGCIEAARGNDSGLRALFSAPATADGHFATPQWAPSLHAIHGLAALAAMALAGAVAYGVRCDRPRLAVALFALSVITLLTGVASESAQPALAFVVIHSAAAAGLCAALAMTAANARPMPRSVTDPLGTTIA